MVRAMLAGRKTQTRRVVVPQPEFEFHGVPFVAAHEIGEAPKNIKCPYGQPGDTLYVKETFRVWKDEDSLFTGRLSFVEPERQERIKKNTEYRATCDPHAEEGNWRPSIFMPPWLSRLTLKVQAVRVERLQDISEEDARAEGADRKMWITSSLISGANNAAGELGTFREGYKDIWNAINGPGAWDANPWVWVVGFEVEKGNRKGTEGAEMEEA